MEQELRQTLGGRYKCKHGTHGAGRLAMRGATRGGLEKKQAEAAVVAVAVNKEFGDGLKSEQILRNPLPFAMPKPSYERQNPQNPSNLPKR